MIAFLPPEKEKAMKRLTAYLAVAILTFGIGVLARSVNPLKWLEHDPAEPLRATISPITRPANSHVSFDYYVVTVKNVSGKTVRGYSLGLTCNCRSWDRDDNPYPPGITYMNPNPERQTLRPGESQEVPVPADELSSRESKPRVWVDLVHFDGGANWGPNASHTDGYVRE